MIYIRYKENTVTNLDKGKVISFGFGLLEKFPDLKEGDIFIVFEITDDKERTLTGNFYFEKVIFCGGVRAGRKEPPIVFPKLERIELKTMNDYVGIIEAMKKTPSEH